MDKRAVLTGLVVMAMAVGCGGQPSTTGGGEGGTIGSADCFTGAKSPEACAAATEKREGALLSFKYWTDGLVPTNGHVLDHVTIAGMVLPIATTGNVYLAAAGNVVYLAGRNGNLGPPSFYSVQLPIFCEDHGGDTPCGQMIPGHQLVSVFTDPTRVGQPNWTFDHLGGYAIDTGTVGVWDNGRYVSLVETTGPGGPSFYGSAWGSGKYIWVFEALTWGAVNRSVGTINFGPYPTVFQQARGASMDVASNLPANWTCPSAADGGQWALTPPYAAGRTFWSGRVDGTGTQYDADLQELWCVIPSSNLVPLNPTGDLRANVLVRVHAHGTSGPNYWLNPAQFGDGVTGCPPSTSLNIDAQGHNYTFRHTGDIYNPHVGFAVYMQHWPIGADLSDSPCKDGVSGVEQNPSWGLTVRDTLGVMEYLSAQPLPVDPVLTWVSNMYDLTRVTTIAPGTAL
jgi:hypothetical protein